jgi:sucrose-6-phosphate hydrolase SacC (GH32 family)
MNLTDLTTLNRKSGEAEWRDLQLSTGLVSESVFFNRAKRRCGALPSGSSGAALSGRLDDRERTVLRYQWEIGKLVLDRTKSSLDPETKRDLQEATYFPRREDVLEVEVYLDVSVVEVFLDGRAAFGTRIYPTLPESEGLALVSFGGEAMVDSVTISRIPGATSSLQIILIRASGFT